MPIADVLIAGAGPAGAALALLLGRRGVRVTLITGGVRTAPHIGEHLSPRGCLALARLGPSTTLAAGHLRCTGIDSIWGDEELQHTDYLMQPAGSGLFLDRSAFDAHLLALATVEPSVTIVAGRVSPQIERFRGTWRVSARAGAATDPVRARFLVDATGRRSLVARALGASRRRVDRQMAVMAWFDQPEGETRDDEPARLLLEAVSGGWWYTSRLPGARRVAAYLTDADQLADEPASSWRRALRSTTHVRPRLPPSTRSARLVARPADSAILTQTSGDGWTAVGEAAVAFDPVSGFGLRHVLEDAMSAMEGVTAALDGSDDWLEGRNDALRQLFAQYLKGRREVYQREMRWPDAPFWARRHAPVSRRFLKPLARTAKRGRS